MAKLRGTDADDQITGTELNDTIVAGAGNDTLSGLGGRDVFRAGTGADTVLGGDGDDTAIFSNLDYTQPDTFDGGTGIDTLDIQKADSPFFHLISWNYDPFSHVYSVGVFGDPSTSAKALTFAGVEHLVGSHENDSFSFSFSPDGFVIDGGLGDDTVSAGDGDDVLNGGVGDDLLNGGLGNGRLFGGSGQDTLILNAAAATGLIDGGDGTDTAILSGDVDLAKGIAHNANGERIMLRSIENVSLTLTEEGSTVRGTDGRNVLDASGSIYGATFSGGGANDRITGGDGGDRINGGDGSDVIDGGFGSDQLTGGGGADRFVFVDDELGRAASTDRITDFSQRANDRIDLAGIDANTNTEALNAFRFIGTRAFGKEAGQLRYEIQGTQTRVSGDTDGDGRADFTIQLNGKVKLDVHDFVLSHFDGAGVHGPADAFAPVSDGVLP